MKRCDRRASATFRFATSRVRSRRRIARSMHGVGRTSPFVPALLTMADVRQGRIACVAPGSAAARIGTPAAMKLWHASLREFRPLHDTAGLAAATGNVGAGFYLEGAIDSAATYLECARVLAMIVGDRRTEGNAVGTLASVYKDKRAYRQARTLYERALPPKQHRRRCAARATIQPRAMPRAIPRATRSPKLGTSTTRSCSSDDKRILRRFALRMVQRHWPARCRRGCARTSCCSNT